jgi:cell shape-determining protein MreD
VAVRLLWFACIALLLALIDSALLAHHWWMPDVMIALLAWSVVDGDEDGVAWRALIVGAARDLAEPGGWGFHCLVFGALGLLSVWARRLLFRRRIAAWAVWAVLLLVLVRGIDALMSGPGDLTLRVLAVQSLGTAAAAMLLGWWLGGLPTILRPVAAGGA